MHLCHDLTSDELRSNGRARMDLSKSARDAFVTLPLETPPAAVVAAYDRIRRPLGEIRGPVHLLVQVHPHESVREAGLEVEQELASFETDLSLDREVFLRLSAVDASALADKEEQRLLEHALRDFRRSGVDRDDATRARIKSLSEELVRLGQRFDRAIASDRRSARFEEGHAALAGLPEDYIAAHPLDAQGGVTITTDGPDYVPFLTYALRDDLRRRLYLEYTRRAAPGNVEVLGEILARRHELAQLLGYAHWADYVTEDKMIRSAAAAREFVEKIAGLARPRLEAEVRELLEAKRGDEPGAGAIHDWDRLHWIERVRARRFHFDSQAVRPYFPYASVRDGVLRTSEALFGIELRRNLAVPVWHASVEAYDVVDGGEVVARFYLDMHPREDKYKHAAMFDLRSGIAGESLPEAALVCNFPEPRADDPALLLHKDVTTFFHEFGHLLHHLFGGRQRYLAFSGIATEWDFVEAPSQMYEEWAWDTGVLQRFARHYKTGEPIPAGLVERMRAAEEYGKGVHVAVQMFYAALALAYHDRDPAGLDLMAELERLKTRLLPFPHERESCFIASFGHLHGYSAIYYTYMWSLVIAKDLYSRFEPDPMDGATANRYRHTILSAGGSRDAADLVRDFLGRQPTFAAWQAWLER